MLISYTPGMYIDGQYRALCLLGLEKTASRWTDYLRTLPVIKQKPLLQKLKRLQGVAPGSFDIVEDPSRLDDAIRSVRAPQKVPHVELAPYGSDLYKAIWRDVRDGRMVKMETGTSLEAAKEILKNGPASYIAGAGGLAPYHDRVREYRRRNRIPNDVPEDVYQAHAAVEEVVRNRLADAGMFAAREGTQRTYDYALRADENNPAKLRFSLPATLAPNISEAVSLEQGVPWAAWRYARNKHIVPLPPGKRW